MQRKILFGTDPRRIRCCRKPSTTCPRWARLHPCTALARKLRTCSYRWCRKHRLGIRQVRIACLSNRCIRTHLLPQSTFHSGTYRELRDHSWIRNQRWNTLRTIPRRCCPPCTCLLRTFCTCIRWKMQCIGHFGTFHPHTPSCRTCCTVTPSLFLLCTCQMRNPCTPNHVRTGQARTSYLLTSHFRRVYRMCTCMS